MMIIVLQTIEIQVDGDARLKFLKNRLAEINKCLADTARYFEQIKFHNGGEIPNSLAHNIMVESVGALQRERARIFAELMSMPIKIG